MPELRELPDGVAWKLGDIQAEVRVASPHAFCLRVHPAGADNPPRSIYLDSLAKLPVPFKILREGAAVRGIETNFGQLLLDPDRQQWSLRDREGKVLADWSPLGKLAPASSAAEVECNLSIGSNPAVPHPLYYGSGTVPNRGALTQQEGKSKADNGTAMLPQYWSTAGYGVLMVGTNDHAPAAWKSDGKGAVAWKIPGNGADLYLCPATDLYAWLRADAELTGFAPVPPLWTLGYLQSRWGWKDKAYIDDTLARFRKDRFPVDAFIIDFEWYTPFLDYFLKPEGMADFPDFKWHSALFPDPAKQIAELARQGVHLMGIRKPRLGDSENLKMAREKGWILKPTGPDADGSGYKSRDLDFSQPNAREWWANHNRQFLEAGMAAFWNDEGEMDFVEYTYWNLAEQNLLQQVHPGSRYWSLNRSMAPGLQRSGASVWTGDYEGAWKVLARQPGELLSYSLAGMPYSGCDIGGMDNELPPELLTRWMQAGVFFPVMRAHSSAGVTPHFPWLFGAEAGAAMRKALELRYRLIPYYYSLAHENSATGAPLMRPLAMEFPEDEKTAALTDEWLMGKGLLAAPVLSEGGKRTVYLPKDRWYALGSPICTEGPQAVQVTSKLDEIPVYVRAGTLLPLGPVRQWTGQLSQEPLELQVYGGRDASLEFVEDDGQTRADQPGATRRITKFTWNDADRTLTWQVSGSYQRANVTQTAKVVLFTAHGYEDHVITLGKNGETKFSL